MVNWLWNYKVCFQTFIIVRPFLRIDLHHLDVIQLFNIFLIVSSLSSLFNFILFDLLLLQIFKHFKSVIRYSNDTVSKFIFISNLLFCKFLLSSSNPIVFNLCDEVPIFLITLLSSFFHFLMIFFKLFFIDGISFKCLLWFYDSCTHHWISK